MAVNDIMNRLQTINVEGKPAFAVLAWQDFRELVDAASAAAGDGAGGDPALRRRSSDNVRRGLEASYPPEITARIQAGENAAKVFREFRGLSQVQLARDTGLNAVYLNEIESGTRIAPAATLARLAQALRVKLEEISIGMDD